MISRELRSEMSGRRSELVSLPRAKSCSSRAQSLVRIYASSMVQALSLEGGSLQAEPKEMGSRVSLGVSSPEESRSGFSEARFGAGWEGLGTRLRV